MYTLPYYEKGGLLLMQLDDYISGYNQLKEKLEKREKELIALTEINATANNSASLDEAMEYIIDIILKTIEEKMLNIRFYDEVNQRFILKASRGMPEWYEEKFKIIYTSEGLFPTILNSSTPTPINDFTLTPREDLRKMFKEAGILSGLGIPISVNSKVVAIIIIFANKKNYFKEKEVTIYKALANQISIIFEKFKLQDNLKHSYLETIKALVKSIEAKDPYTRGHAGRVANYSLLIGKELNLDKNFLHNLEIAAILHDIGKIAIPETILSKPGKLNGYEFDIIRTHPFQGKQILEPIRFEHEVFDGVYYHHERLDGSGYPMGLRNGEIPLIARILAVADSFDAMTSNRPYRQALPISHALAELTSFSELHFDSQVVEAFLRVWKKSNYFISDEEDF